MCPFPRLFLGSVFILLLPEGKVFFIIPKNFRPSGGKHPEPGGMTNITFLQQLPCARSAIFCYNLEACNKKCNRYLYSYASETIWNARFACLTFSLPSELSQSRSNFLLVRETLSSHFILVRAISDLHVQGFFQKILVATRKKKHWRGAVTEKRGTPTVAKLDPPSSDADLLQWCMSGYSASDLTQGPHTLRPEFSLTTSLLATEQNMLQPNRSISPRSLVKS